MQILEGLLRPFQGVCEVKATFTVILTMEILVFSTLVCSRVYTLTSVQWSF